ncbi:MAG: NTP transferase domain-containing protein [Anaerolineaceae bacterium]|nr:NTP transferase domain-containing protein [Anaerolineaceae bacterium]
MKGIILAGGTGSRLRPLTKVTNKHLLPVGRYPMIYHPIYKLVGGGVTEILVVTGREHMGDIVSLLGSGTEFGSRFTYKVQDEAGGIAQALGLSRHFVGGDRCCVILGDQVFEDSIAPFVENYEKQAGGAKILLKEVADAPRFGVAELSTDRKTVVGIEEKPERPKSNLAVTGIYFYDAEVFRIVETLKPSGRGELEITDVNNYYIEQGRMTWDLLGKPWTDAGTFESLLRANVLMKDIDITRC